jgi:cellulose synthase/poly-beta-1,6-N-acetylglucosamine synthase-like glycosyltransferase
MMMFKKGYSVKIISIILIASLLYSADAYSADTIDAIFVHFCKRNVLNSVKSLSNLRKPLDFNNKKESIVLRYILTAKRTEGFRNLQKNTENPVTGKSKGMNLLRRENLLYGTVFVAGIVTCIGLSILLNGGMLGILRQFLLLPFILSFYATLGNAISGIFIKKDTEKPERLPYEKLPFVTVQIPIRNEKFDVVKICLDSALELSYPKNKIEIQIIDNSDIEFSDYRKIKEYAESRGIIFIHRGGIEGLKARNLNIGMESARGDYFLILDADSSVASDSLLDALPEFFIDNKLGFASFDFSIMNADTNSFTKGLSYSESLNQTVLEPVRDRFGAAQFHGSNGIWKREILEKIGRWNEETFSEDFEASIDTYLYGYKGKLLTYVKSGKSIPETTIDFVKQRKRWVFWTVDLLFRKIKAIIFSKNMTFAQKTDSLYHLSYYIGAAFIIPFSFTILFIIDNPVLPYIILITQLPWVILVVYNFIANKRIDGHSVLQKNINNMILSGQAVSLVPIAAFEAIISLLTKNKKVGYFITPKISSGKAGFFRIMLNYKNQFIIAALFIGLFFTLVPYDIRMVLYSPLFFNMSNMISAPFFFKEVKMRDDETNKPILSKGVDIERAGKPPKSVAVQKSNKLRSTIKDALDNRRLLHTDFNVFSERLPLFYKIKELTKSRRTCNSAI